MRIRQKSKSVLNHLGLVPCLCLSTAAVGDVFILSLDFSNDGIHVQVAAVVHLHNDGSVLDLALELMKFLKKYQKRD